MRSPELLNEKYLAHESDEDELVKVKSKKTFEQAQCILMERKFYFIRAQKSSEDITSNQILQLQEVQ